MIKMAEVLGIDLGTTKSAMAIIDEMDRPTLIKNKDGSRLLDSAVLFKEDKTIVGQRAVQSSLLQPENLATFSKRHMCDEEWEFPDGWGNRHRPEEISGIILKRLKDDAERALDTEVEKAVITVPAYFQDMERNRTRTAGETAGFEVLRLINEPTAAAVAYGLDRLDEEMTTLVYDLGGGTFDVTIMEIQEAEIKAIASGGDRFLGGADFDKLIVERVQKQFDEEHGIDPADDLRSYRELMDKAREAKETLSIDTETPIRVSKDGYTLDYELTRDEFNSLIEHIISDTERITEETLNEANMKWEDIDKLVCTGGSTRVPFVQDRLKQLSGKEPDVSIDPDEVVAKGAAILAAQEEGLTVRDSAGKIARKVNVIDVIAHSLGLKVWDREDERYKNVIMIPKGSPVPAEATDFFTTIKDNQTRVNKTILQGETEDPDHCKVVGEENKYVIRDIPPQPEGVPSIKTTMKFDKEGMIHMYAKEESSGSEISVDVERPDLLTQEEKEKMSEDIQVQNID